MSQKLSSSSECWDHVKAPPHNQEQIDKAEIKERGALWPVEELDSGIKLDIYFRLCFYC